MREKYQFKAVFVTEDGENFLCIRQLYLNDLYTGKLIDGKIYQGRKFKLMEETNVNDHRQLSRRQEIS
jgi:hypothetical protein